MFKYSAICCAMKVQIFCTMWILGEGDAILDELYWPAESSPDSVKVISRIYPPSLFQLNTSISTSQMIFWQFDKRGICTTVFETS